MVFRGGFARVVEESSLAAGADKSLMLRGEAAREKIGKAKHDAAGFSDGAKTWAVACRKGKLAHHAVRLSCMEFVRRVKKSFWSKAAWQGLRR